MSDTQFLIGAHMSIAGGIHKAIYRGEELGCTAIQVFTRSNRQWSFDTTYAQEQKDAFHAALQETNVQHVVSHAAYLINVGSPNESTEDKSVRALEAELKRCSEIGIPYVVLHPGSYKGGDKQACLRQISRNLDTVMRNAPDNVWLLLETMAGQGSSIGTTFDEIAHICDNIPHNNNIGFCFDTCHAFAAGYTFDDADSYAHMWQTFDQHLGIDKLHTIHLNDSKKQAGSYVDRHEHIGQGRMGLDPFRYLMNDKRLFHIPKILETPKDAPDDDPRNLRVLYQLLTDQHKREITVYFPKQT